jgi:hypothetical protein
MSEVGPTGTGCTQDLERLCVRCHTTASLKTQFELVTIVGQRTDRHTDVTPAVCAIAAYPDHAGQRRFVRPIAAEFDAWELR